jgi:hypothetical protein
MKRSLHPFESKFISKSAGSGCQPYQDGNKLISITDRAEASRILYGYHAPIIAGILFIVECPQAQVICCKLLLRKRTAQWNHGNIIPNQLSGKVIADITVGITQLVVWAIFVILALVIGKNYFPWLNNTNFQEK